MSKLQEKSFTIPLKNGKTLDAIMTLPLKGFKSGHGVILTHGAGGDMNYEHLKVLAKYLAENDMACLRFTCKPTVMKTRITAMTAVLNFWKQLTQYPLKKCFLAGRSMGSRVAATLAQELSGEKDPIIAGVICLSYPLHPPGKTQEIRHLQPGVPVLFVNGKRDALCDAKLMEKEVSNLQCPYHLHWIEGGDHGVKVKGRKQGEILQELCTTVVNWCHTTLTGDDDKPPIRKKAKTVKDYFKK